MTPAERELWMLLRNRNFHGLKFLRQHPFIYAFAPGKKFYFIADFYCAERHLVIELDGQYHEYQQQKDYSRDLILEKKGIKTLRIKNEELMNMEVVLQKIRSALNLTD
jgi:leucyl-tRNA synthetase